MILKFDEYINEGLWAKGVERSQSGDKRLENGHKYKTSLGVVIEINCSNEDVEEIIETILNSVSEDDGLGYDIVDGDMLVGSDGEDDVYIAFPDYSDIVEDYYDNVSEEDYSTILDSIGTAIKNNVGKYTNIIPTRSFNGYAVLLNQKIMDEIGEDEGWDAYRKMLGNWVNQRDKYQKSHGFDLGEWSDWTIYLNYDSIKDFPKIYEDVQNCLKKWRDEYDNENNEDWEEE